jgi:hypothetical protein
MHEARLTCPAAESESIRIAMGWFLASAPSARYRDVCLETLFGRPVDLVTAVSLENPYFRERVLAERQLVYAR